METPIAEFKVRHISLAARCEVCHQDDFFNPETGECVRCRDTLAALEASPPATAAEAGSPPHSFGWRLASAALILSIILAIPGTMALVVILYFFIGTLISTITRGELLLFLAFMGGSLGFIGAGYYLLHWYWKIWGFVTESRQRRRVWLWSTVYNLLLLLGMTFFLRGLAGEPLGLLWFGPVGLMTVISGLALLEEYKPR